MDIRQINSKSALLYFEGKDPFFAPQGKGENSMWLGRIASILEKGNDRIDFEMFEKIMQGDFFETKQKEYIGYDLIFAAPKSVSILYLMGDKRFEEIHDTAVKTTLQYVEDNFIQPENYYYDESISYDMLAARFRHAFTIANEPQLHDHIIIMDATYLEDGTFGTLSQDALFTHPSLMNNIYLNEFARGIQNLGFEIDNYKHTFELVGLEEIMDKFPNTQNMIDEYFKEFGSKLTNSEIRDLVNFGRWL